jgi:hypothetical protein
MTLYYLDMQTNIWVYILYKYPISCEVFMCEIVKRCNKEYHIVEMKVRRGV